MISKLFCWLGFHDWLCLLRWPRSYDDARTVSEFTVWECSRCNKQQQKQWDF